MALGIFTDDFYPYIGGMGRYVWEVSRRLPAGRFRVFSPCDLRLPEHVHVSPPLHAVLRNIGFSLWLARHLKRTVTEHGLTRINLQCGPGGLFLLRPAPVPMVATCYHTWWQQSRLIPAQRWKRVFVPLERRTYRLAERVVCISGDSRDVLLKNYRVPVHKTVVVPPGIDIRRFTPLEGTAKIPLSLLYVGRIDRRKGVDFLIRAMPSVVRRLPEVKLFVGGTGQGLPAAKALVEELELRRNVVFLGFIPDEELNLWYNKVQAVVVPSVFEGFGLAAAEAMAAGTCVVATEVDALRRLVEDGRSGLLVPYGDCRRLGERLVQVLSDGDLRRRLSASGRARVVAEFDWGAVAGRLAAELIGSPAPAATGNPTGDQRG